jgi:hypothetical protein
VKTESFDRFRSFLCGVFLLAILPPDCNSGTQPLISALASIPDVEGRVAEAVRVDHAPKLDGTLDDPLWQSAKPTLSTAAKLRRSGKFDGIPCEVRLIRRMENHWYAVLFYTDEFWVPGCKWN